MLNQAPIIVSQHNLHIAAPSRHVRSVGFGRATSPGTLAAATGNATQDSATSLNRIEQNMMDSVYGGKAEEGTHAAKRDQSFHFRGGHKQTAQNAAEDLTAQEVMRERKHRAHMVGHAGGAPAPGASPAAAAPAGGAPAPAPMASPAASPEEAKEEEDGNSGFVMDEDLGAPSQGFSGEIVEHDNMKTQTQDWRGEYGPGNGRHDFVKICALYPDNQWCRDRGYHKTTPRPRSAAVRPAGGAILTFVIAASCRFLLA